MTIRIFIRPQQYNYYENTAPEKEIEKEYVEFSSEYAKSSYEKIVIQRYMETVNQIFQSSLKKGQLIELGEVLL